MHGITEQQWLEFSEGSGDPAERIRIGTHLEACAECRNVYRELTAWHRSLAIEGLRLREALALPDAAMERMLAESLARVSSLGKPSGNKAAEGIATLRGLLSPVLGAGTVRATIDAALRIAAPGGISVATWRAFASQWRDAIQSICGQTAGQLAERAALALAVTE